MFPPFEETLKSRGLGRLVSGEVTTLQVNMGRLCNQACKHCHVDAGPKRTEIMSRETVHAVLTAVQNYKIPTLDITGGAPELNSNFENLVLGARQLGAHVIVRHNLTVQFESGMERLSEFFAENGVELIASLPYFLVQQTDSQRGNGIFDLSIKAMRQLNGIGYGQPNSGLELHLVCNPAGAFLPPEQSSSEGDFKRELETRYGLVFNRLYTITNMPINRFLDYLHRSGNYERYMTKLITSFNPATVVGLMCRNMISVGWNGRLYDCDFNQMLDLDLGNGHAGHVGDLNPAKLAHREIVTGIHCYGCTAGAGSSCGGTLVE